MHIYVTRLHLPISYLCNLYIIQLNMHLSNIPHYKMAGVFAFPRSSSYLKLVQGTIKAEFPM